MLIPACLTLRDLGSWLPDICLRAPRSCGELSTRTGRSRSQGTCFEPGNIWQEHFKRQVEKKQVALKRSLQVYVLAVACPFRVLSCSGACPITGTAREERLSLVCLNAKGWFPQRLSSTIGVFPFWTLVSLFSKRGGFFKSFPAP